MGNTNNSQTEKGTEPKISSTYQSALSIEQSTRAEAAGSHELTMPGQTEHQKKPKPNKFKKTHTHKTNQKNEKQNQKKR